MANIKQEVKPMLGPTNPNTGQIKVLYKSEIDGFEIDSGQMSKMASLGLPTNFEFGSLNSGGASKLRTKQQKKTFWCEVCKLELNSEDTMQSHVRGSKHMKKVIASSGGQDVNAVIPIANPQATRKKIPIRLQQKIIESPQYIVGLNFIKEYIACSNSEMEPHYECHLCETKGQSNCMFQHLVGQKHRQAYANSLYENDPAKMDLSQKELLDLAIQFNENNEGLYDRIETKYSDDEYPWPPGTEPWLIENGGSGIIPDGARNNFGKTRPKDSQLMSNLKKETKPFVANNDRNVPTPAVAVFTVPDIANVKPPGSGDDVKRMFQLGKELLIAGASGVQMDPRVKNLLDMTLSAMEMKLSRAPSKTGSSTSSLDSSSSAKKMRSPSTSSRHNSYQGRSSQSHYDSRDSRSRSRSFSDRSYDEDYPRREPSHSSSRQRDDYSRPSSSSSSHKSYREGSSSKRRYEEDYNHGSKRSNDYYNGGSSSRRYGYR